FEHFGLVIEPKFVLRAHLLGSFAGILWNIDYGEHGISLHDSSQYRNLPSWCASKPHRAGCQAKPVLAANGMKSTPWPLSFIDAGDPEGLGAALAADGNGRAAGHTRRDFGDGFADFTIGSDAQADGEHPNRPMTPDQRVNTGLGVAAS